jgi:anti-sigma B factor antagonist
LSEGPDRNIIVADRVKKGARVGAAEERHPSLRVGISDWEKPIIVEADSPTGPSVLDDDNSTVARRPSLEIVVRRAAGRTQVVVSGELDDSKAPILRDRLVQVTANLVGDLELDIGLLTFMDSTGLALFVAQHKRLESMGSHLIIASPGFMARRLFQITGLTQVLTIEPPK